MPPRLFWRRAKEKCKLEHSPRQGEAAGRAGQWCALGFGREGQRERQGSTTGGKNTALETDVNEDVGGEMVKGEAGRWLQGEKQREPLPGRSGDSQEARCTSKEHWGMKAERRQEAVGG